MYATPADMISYFRADELAQRGAPEAREVDGVLIRLTIEDGDRSDYSADAIAAADAALVKITLALQDASETIDSYLSARYAVPVIDTGVVGVLQRPCADLARCNLFTEGMDERMQTRCQQIREWLRDIAKGVVSLPFSDSGSIQSRGVIRV